jgi:hypothetical protein
MKKYECKKINLNSTYSSIKIKKLGLNCDKKKSQNSKKFNSLKHYNFDFRVVFEKIEYAIITIKCVNFVWNFDEWRQFSANLKRIIFILSTDFYIAKALVATRIRHSFSFSYQRRFFFSENWKKNKIKKSTWILRTQVLKSKN